MAGKHGAVAMAAMFAGCGCGNATMRARQAERRPAGGGGGGGIPGGFGAASGSRRLGTMPTSPRSQENANIYKELFSFLKKAFLL